MCYKALLKYFVDIERAYGSVNDEEARSILPGPLQVALAHSLKKLDSLTLEPIRFSSIPCALLSEFDRDVEQDGEIRLQIALHPLLKCTDPIMADAAAIALVSVGGVREAIAQHDFTLPQRRENNAG